MISSNSHHLIDQVPLSPTLHKTASAEKLFQTHVHEPVRHRFFIKGTEITRAILEGIEEMEEYEDLQDILHLFQTDASKKRFGFPGLEVAIENFEEYIRGRGEDNKEFDFYKNLLPKIAQYALEATESELIERLPLIEMHQQGSFIVKPKDVRCILANAFFLNISSEIHNFMQKDRERDFGVLDFNRLYVCRLEESIERIICQLSYFYQQANHEQQLCIDREDIVFTRHNLTVEEEPNWAEMKDTDFSNAEETKSLIKLHDGRMEDILCRGFVDFANRFIHIGSIIPSLTQEEILFSCCPESFLTLLICESLSDTEIMTMRGMIRYSEYKGYLDTFEFTGLYEPLGHTIDIIIMDAISRKHFQPEMIKRDLNKAYLGFKNVNEKEITSGRWGCGAFGGDFCLKFVQQLCAAKLTGKSVYYSTFKDKQCFDDLTEVFESIISSKITIGELYYIMSTFHEYRAINSKGYFIDYLRQELQRKKQ